MKSCSDHFRSSDVQDIIKQLQSQKVEVITYEPSCEEELFEGLRVEKDLETFKTQSDVIVANRISNNLIDVKSKIYMRDIFNSDM